MKQNKHLKRWVAFVLAFALILNVIVKDYVFVDAAGDISIVADDGSAASTATTDSASTATTDSASTATTDSASTATTDSASTATTDSASTATAEISSSETTDSESTEETDDTTGTDEPVVPATKTIIVHEVDHATITVRYTGLNDDGTTEIKEASEGETVAAVEGEKVHVQVSAGAGYVIKEANFCDEMNQPVKTLDKEVNPQGEFEISVTVGAISFNTKKETLEYGATYKKDDLFTVSNAYDGMEWDISPCSVPTVAESIFINVSYDGVNKEFKFETSGKALKENVDYNFIEKYNVNNVIYINQLDDLKILNNNFKQARILCTSETDEATIEKLAEINDWKDISDDTTLASLFNTVPTTDNMILLQLRAVTDNGTKYSSVLKVVLDKTGAVIDNLEIDPSLNPKNGWYTGDDVKIKGHAKDTNSNCASGLGVVKYMVDADSKNEKTAALDEKTGTFEIVCEQGEHEYAVTAYDKAGNPSEEKTIKIYYDNTVPTLGDITVSADEEKEWYSAADGPLKITGSVEDEMSGVAKVEYYIDEDTSSKEITVDKNGKFEIDCIEGKHTYGVVVTDKVDKKYKIEKVVCYDVTLPEEKVYIQYDTDLTEEKIDKEGWLGNIVDKLFGKETIKATVFVKDSLSGINSVKVNDKEYTDKIDGDVKFDGGEIDADGYVGFAVNFKANKESQKVKVEAIKDVAGNVRTEGINGEVLEDTTVLYIDNTAPKLAINLEKDAKIYKQLNNEQNDYAVYNPETEDYKLYFKDDFTPEITIIEDFFKDGDKILGTMKSESNEFKSITDGTKWALEETRTSKYKYADGTFKTEKESEAEYAFSFSYIDGSKFAMEAEDDDDSVKGGTIEGGLFTSKTIVIDKKAPIISNVTFRGDVHRGNDVYLANDGSVNVIIEFDINETYLRDFKVIAKSGADTIEIPYNSKNRNTTIDENQHCTVKVPIDIDKDGHWKFTLEATDKAGNITSLDGTDDTVLEKTTVISDFTAPTLSVSYGNENWANITTSTDASAEDGTEISSSAVECFVTEDTSVTFEIKEENFVNDVFITKNYQADDSKNELSFTQIVPAANFTKVEGEEEEDTYSYTMPITKEGHYKFILTYSDLAANEVVAAKEDETTGKCLTNGVFTTPAITVDKTAPVIVTTFDKEKTNTQSGRDYYADDKITMTVTITEENFRASDFNMDYTKYKYDGKNVVIDDVTISSTGNKIPEKEWTVSWVEDENGVAKQTWTTNVEWHASYNYDMSYTFADLAKQNVIASDSIAVDNVKPTITIEELEGKEACDILFANDDEGKDFLHFINYKHFAHFAKDKVFTIIKAHDDAAGVKEVAYKLLGEDGKTVVEEGILVNESKNLGQWTAKTVVIDADFKGYVQAQAIDRSMNKGDIMTPKGVVSETKNKHNETSKLTITTVTAPSRTVGDVNYYNSDVTVDLHIEDNHSGIQSYEYKAGTTVSDSLNYSENPGSKDDASAEKANQYKFDKTVVMPSGETNYTNRENPSEVNITYTCNAGYKETKTEKYVIDSIAPVIDVVWNPTDAEASNEKYYKDTRTATITVTERNFDEAGVDWSAIVQNNPDGYSISDWTHDGDTHTCTVSFTDDGDYTLGFSITDYATNKTVWDEGTEFTIDKTKPVISITFDNMNAANEIYYNASRTATLHVEEHNFESADVEIQQTAELDGSAIGSPTLGGWSDAEDHHTADIYYGEDGDYTLNFTYTDLAGNEADVISEEIFVIDQTVPVIEISDLAAPYAYNETVAPRVTYSDVNMDANSLSVSLVGYMNGSVSYDRQAPSAVDNGFTEKWNDFPHEENVDDIYTLKVSVQDMAGNSFSDEALFSVNRFGSTYMYGAATEANIDKYYNKQEFDVEVIEVNVSELALDEEKPSVQVKDEENQLKDLAEGADYTITKGSNEHNWPAYTYVIDKSNFEDENLYNVTFSSLDKATNKMSNEAKDLSVEFVIDKTNPTGVITGLEEERIEENEREISVSAMDNYKLEKAVLVINNEEVQTFEADAFNNAKQMVAYKIAGNKEWQSIGLKIVDAAGNETIIDPVSRLITADGWVQFINNKPLFYGSVIGAVAVALGVIGAVTKGFGYQASMAAGTGFWFVLFGKRRKEDEEEQK